MPAGLNFHELLVKAHDQCDGDGPRYGWVYDRVVSGEVPAEKVGGSWRFPPEAPRILAQLWLSRARRSARPRAAS